MLLGKATDFFVEPEHDDAVIAGSPVDKNRIIHFSPAETIRVLRETSSPSPEPTTPVNPFFVRQLNGGSLSKKRLEYFRSAVADNFRDGKEAPGFDLQDLTDPFKVKGMNNRIAGKRMGYFNTGEYGERPKEIKEPFIFETRVSMVL